MGWLALQLKNSVKCVRLHSYPTLPVWPPAPPSAECESFSFNNISQLPMILNSKWDRFLFKIFYHLTIFPNCKWFSFSRASSPIPNLENIYNIGEDLEYAKLLAQILQIFLIFKNLLYKHIVSIHPTTVYASTSLDAL